MSDTKPDDTKVEQPVSEETVVPEKSPASKPKSSNIEVKLVRRLGDGNALVEATENPGEFYLVAMDTFEEGLRTASINPKQHQTPFDWKKMLDAILPSREQMIVDAYTHLVKNGMVEEADLSNNAKRSKAFAQMLNYSIPKPETKE